MPAAPFAIALVGVALARTATRPAVRGVALTLAGWTAVVAWLLWNDPHAANDCAQLLARSTFADGNAYLPNLFIRAWSDAAPGSWARVLAWIAIAGWLAAWTARAAQGRGATSPVRSLAGGAVVLLAVAFALERWPLTRRAPVFPDAVELRPGVTAFTADGREVLARSREPLASVRIRATGEGSVRVAGLPPFMVGAGGTEADVPLLPIAHLTGRRGVEEWLYRQGIEVEGPVTIGIVR
jgi:hypothetical protein